MHCTVSENDKKILRGMFFILKNQSVATFSGICDHWSVGVHHFYFDHEYRNLGHFRLILGENTQI